MIRALDGCGDFFEVPFDIVPDQLSNIVCPLQYLMGKDVYSTGQPFVFTSGQLGCV